MCINNVQPDFRCFFQSDISIKLDGETLYGHRFILAARSRKWDSQQLDDAAELDLSGSDLNKHLFSIGNAFFLL